MTFISRKLTALRRVWSPALPATPAFFRRIDWLAFALVFAVVGLGYYLTLAPEVTLEDSGELATGSYYAGIPHPPGYPVWTLYTWLWTVLVPCKNIAWRVALGEAVAGAAAAAVLGLLVSRGSSLFLEGIEELRSIPARAEKAICLVSGCAAGLLLGFNGFMWSQSVIVEVYAFGVLSLMVVLAWLLRWIYAPGQRRFLYLALFFFGVCFTNHQTLIVAAMGIEVALAAADFRLGRSLFLGNTVIYLMGWLLVSEGVLTALSANPAVYVIFHVVGVASLVAYAGFAWLTREKVGEFVQDSLYAIFWVLLASLPALGIGALVLALAALAGFARVSWNNRRLGGEWLVVLACGGCWVLGASFYFYMPLAGMTNPPMQWGYPRTVDGFIHAFTRGQYEKTHPTDLVNHPAVFVRQLIMLGGGIGEEFNWVFAAMALIPFLFFRRMRRPERAWLIGLAAIYACLGVLLLILLNPPLDRSAQQLHRVFFTASHTLVALLVGYGLALTAAFMATRYERFRSWGLGASVAAILLAWFSFVGSVQDAYFIEGPFFGALAPILSLVQASFQNANQYALPVYAGLLLLVLTGSFAGALFCCRRRAPLALGLGLFALMPVYSVLTHWADNEQRNHWFGYWFGHDMFSPPFKGADGKPIYAEMPRHPIIFGGTDAGRFCPTYMIFCESFLPHGCQPVADQAFDRRDAYIITQNALADPPYLNSLRAQYNPSTQADAPFFQELARVALRDHPAQTNLMARALAPLDYFFGGLGDRMDTRRRIGSSQFAPGDFVDLSALAARLRRASPSDPVGYYVSQHLAAGTRTMLAEPRANKPALRRRLAADFSRLIEASAETPALTSSRSSTLAADEPLYNPERFRSVTLDENLATFLRENPRGLSRVRLNRLLLEAAFPRELARSPGGVYPDREIRIPSPEDASQCYETYRVDAQRRQAQQQLEPGEDVRFEDGKMLLGGQVSIMAINGLFAKLVFERNTNHEFFVEESMPLKWMFPYLSPYGIIMRLNRQPVSEISEEMVRRDHEFWCQYSERLVGNWITYGTSVQDLVAWTERVYVRHDYTGFTGDRRFIRDDQAQKCFSKLRSAIGEIYARRLRSPNAAELTRAVAEAEFAFRQAFAFCPYHIETVAHYVQLLANLHRFDDALLIARTCLKLDPNNGQVTGMISNLETWKRQEAEGGPAAKRRAEMEQAVRANPLNFQARFDLAAFLLAIAQTNRALETLHDLVLHPQANAQALQVAALALGQLGDFPATQTALEKLTRLQPEDPGAWLDLGALEAITGHKAEALADLKRALECNAKQIQRDPKAHNLREDLAKDARLASLRQEPEFQRLLVPRGQ